MDNTNNHSNAPRDEAPVFLSSTPNLAGNGVSGSQSQHPSQYRLGPFNQVGQSYNGNLSDDDVLALIFNDDKIVGDATCNGIRENNSNVNSPYHLNGIGRIPTENFNFENPNLNAIWQARTADALLNSQGAAPNVSIQGPPYLFKEGTSLSWLDDARRILNVEVTSQPGVPEIGDSDSSSMEAAYGTKASAAYHIGESSNKKRRIAQGVPLTIREATQSAFSRQVPTFSASQVNLHEHLGSPKSLYDPVYEKRGYPVDPLLRMFQELQEKEKNQNQ